MGIKGLLNVLKPIAKEINVKERYAGKRLGLDIMCIIHRGAIACAYNMALDLDSTNKDRYIPILKFVAKMVDMYSKNSELICVFDGEQLPLKKEENADRREKREEAKAAFIKAYSEKVKDHFKLQSLASRAIALDKEVITQVASMLIKKNIPYIVAPYEADAQLAYLCRIKYIDAVLSEDSDLLAFKCPRLICKLQPDGSAVEYDISELTELDIDRMSRRGILRTCCPKTEYPQLVKKITGKDFGHDRFICMCILSGCDYVPNSLHINGIGLNTAVPLLYRFKTLESVLRNLPLDDKWKTKIANLLEERGIQMDDIRESHLGAYKAFTSHLVFDPNLNVCVEMDSETDSCIQSQPLFPENFQGVHVADMENFPQHILGSAIGWSRQKWLGHLFMNSANECMNLLRNTRNVSTTFEFKLEKPIKTIKRELCPRASSEKKARPKSRFSTKIKNQS